MTGPVLRAGAWPAVLGVTGVAVVVGGWAAALDTVWWTVLAMCAVTIAISAGGRRLPQWRPRVP